MISILAQLFLYMDANALMAGCVAVKFFWYVYASSSMLINVYLNRYEYESSIVLVDMLILGKFRVMRLLILL